MTHFNAEWPDRRQGWGRDVIVVGEFDGYHRGHRALVRQAASVAGALGCPLRGIVLDARDGSDHLTPIEQRTSGILAAGAVSCEALVVDGGLSANDLVASKIVDRYQPAITVLACPPELPADRRSLATAFGALGAEVLLVQRCHRRGSAVTSERVRAALDAGDVEAANDLVGAPFEVEGVVVQGAQLGRTIGFPTANLDPPAGRRLPASGVYAGVVGTENGETWDAAINLGTRPSVAGSHRLLIEAHLIGFCDDLYGQRIRVRFAKRLRDERRFEGLDALTDQLRQDVRYAASLRPEELLSRIAD